VASIRQLGLLAGGAPGLPSHGRVPARRHLGAGAWIDLAVDWLPGADAWFDLLATDGDWRAQSRPMYDAIVDVPRLVWSSEHPETAVPGLADLRTWFERHYHRRFPSIGCNWYRDGRDSVATHRDRVRSPSDTVVAIVSLGGRRPVIVRPDGGGPSERFHLGHGDLFVMGGSFQATHRHGVPKVAHADPRISVMFRTCAARAEPVGGGSLTGFDQREWP
jgi:alkylated DNA repair dioxygenase AlkB